MENLTFNQMETIRQEIREVWQRGAVAGVPPLLQPVAHGLLQVVEDLDKYMRDFPPDKLWERPAGVASVGFHLLHIAGVIDRLFTYARGEWLTVDQLKALEVEKEVPAEPMEPSVLVGQVRRKVEYAIRQLKTTLESSLTKKRLLGRKKIPTTVIGLFFHATEHAHRHVGQLLVTARIVTHKEEGKGGELPQDPSKKRE